MTFKSIIFLKTQRGQTLYSKLSNDNFGWGRSQHFPEAMSVFDEAGGGVEEMGLWG